MLPVVHFSFAYVVTGQEAEAEERQLREFFTNFLRLFSSIFRTIVSGSFFVFFFPISLFVSASSFVPYLFFVFIYFSFCSFPVSFFVFSPFIISVVHGFFFL